MDFKFLKILLFLFLSEGTYATAIHSFDCNHAWMDFANNVYGYMATYIENNPNSTKQERDTERDNKTDEFFNSYLTETPEYSYLAGQCLISKTTEGNISYRCENLASVTHDAFKDMFLIGSGFLKKDQDVVLNHFFQKGIIESNGTATLPEILKCLDNYEPKVGT